MIQIDMPMPENCIDCRFLDDRSASCNVSRDPGFVVFVGLQKTELIEWDDWKQKASSGRDPRCPLKHIGNYYSEVFNVGYKAGKESIVRCKDCKWWDKKDGANYGYCHACKHGYSSDKWEIGIYRTYKGDWFCADGVKKNDDI